ncbi:MAG: penicillin-binding protein 1A [Wenzhouxiangellaceae bacterium]
MIGITLLWLILAPSLPSVDSLREVELQVPLSIHSADGQLISTVGEQRRIPLAIDQIPDRLKQAFIAAEDAHFHQHPGVDWRGTLRGVVGYARYLGKRRVPGGSTITQQVARRFFLSAEFSVTRKLREIFLAIRIEREMSKDEILELYLNKEFLGHRAYGVGAAAQIYYGKSVDDLTLPEMAMIAGLPQRPSVVNPVSNPAAALNRRAYVLRRMREEGFIDEPEYRSALTAPDHARVHGPRVGLSAPWIAEIARLQAVERFGANAAYTRGYSVTTTVDSRLQRAADRAVRDGLNDYDRRHGWRGPERRLDPELLEQPELVMEELAAIGQIADLRPAVVLQSDAEQAQLVLADGREVVVELDQIGWAREHLARDALGRRPDAVSDVLQVGDVVRVRSVDGEEILAQVPEAQAALVALEPETGAVLALVGGLDFGASQFNRATQSRRQPGSAFKPFIYAAALDHGYTPASLVNDAPIVFDDPSQERAWKPTNFSQQFFGPTRLREGMVHSRNLISVRLAMGIGLENAIEYASRFGFARGNIPRGPSMALGTASISPLDLAVAYATFANDGFAIEPFFVHAIVDDKQVEFNLPPVAIACATCEQPTTAPAADGSLPATREQLDVPRRLDLGLNAPESERVGDESNQAGSDSNQPAESPIEIHGPPLPRLAPRVISPQTSWLLRSMMSDVITEGTGRRALALGRGDLAGKTGTTNDLRDTWFAGFNDSLVATVWVGMDGNETLGRLEQGGRTALPIWVDFMRTALDGVAEKKPPVPTGIVEASIDPNTGNRVRPGTPGSIREWFPAGNLPPLQDGDLREDDETTDPYDIF